MLKFSIEFKIWKKNANLTASFNKKNANFKPLKNKKNHFPENNAGFVDSGLVVNI